MYQVCLKVVDSRIVNQQRCYGRPFSANYSIFVDHAWSMPIKRFLKESSTHAPYLVEVYLEHSYHFTKRFNVQKEVETLTTFTVIMLEKGYNLQNDIAKYRTACSNLNAATSMS